ncbi:MAG: calcium-binding protein, partial [Hyphomicrobium sp.]
AFVFHGGGGNDVILDFQKGIDVLQVAKNINGLQVESAKDVAVLATSDNGSAVIDFGNGDSITLLGVAAEDIHDDPSKFILVV